MKKWGFVGFVVFMRCLQFSFSFSLSVSKNTLLAVTESHVVKKLFHGGHTKNTNFNFTEQTAKYGYVTEKHEVITKDGYILTIFHFLVGKNCSGTIKPTPVVLQHGVADSSDTFIVARPGVGLAYILADACYDVWCPNFRGNRYSRHHVTWDPDNDSNYWNFTFDQHGMFDLPATVDYILNKTHSEKISYIGHSQGTTNLFILLSTMTEYNGKFEIAICLAPIAWLKHMFSPLAQIASKASPAVMLANDLVGPQEIGGNVLTDLLCSLLPEILCGQIISLVSGLNPKTVSRDTLSLAFGYYPTATSTNNLLHFAQAVNVDKFRRYDYGKETNLKVYGTAEPPDYDVSKVSAPVALVTCKNDWFVSEKDVNTLKSKLRNIVDHYVVPKNDWSHFTLCWGEDIPEVLAPKVIEYLEMFD